MLAERWSDLSYGNASDGWRYDAIYEAWKGQARTRAFVPEEALDALESELQRQDEAEEEIVDRCARRLLEACERALSRGADPGEAERRRARAEWSAFSAGLPGPGAGAPPDESTGHPVYWQESAARVRVGYHLEDVRDEGQAKGKKGRAAA